MAGRIRHRLKCLYLSGLFHPVHNIYYKNRKCINVAKIRRVSHSTQKYRRQLSLRTFCRRLTTFLTAHECLIDTSYACFIYFCRAYPAPSRILLIACQIKHLIPGYHLRQPLHIRLLQLHGGMYITVHRNIHTGVSEDFA